MTLRFLAACAMTLLPILAMGQAAEPPSDDDPSLHAQATYVAQRKPAFPAQYSGPNSLSTEAAHSYSFTSTLMASVRPWEGGEAVANVEAVQGVPFSNLTGLGGLSNGELQKTSGPNLTWYWARLFARHTFDTHDRGKVVITAGKFAVMDLFDVNRYAHDPRADFLNWTLITGGAYDFAADSRGYTLGAAVEWITERGAVRAGHFAQPKESNGLPLDHRIFAHYGDQVEVERAYEIAGRAGRGRILAFRNVAIMGRFREALADAQDNAITPDLARVRRLTNKYGVSGSVEQDIAAGLGAFIRASWNNGETETYAFTEVDRSVAAGLALAGAAWGRAGDTLAIALVSNGLSRPHRDYLAAGGLGFFLGDGRITYRSEQIAETYYKVVLSKHFAVSADAQYLRNPGYNADRGPVRFLGVRLHAEI